MNKLNVEDIVNELERDSCAWHKLVKEKRLDAIKYLAKKGLIELDATRSNKTALHICAKDDLPEIARFLIESGANADINYGDYTPLQAAANSGNLQMVLLFLEYNVIIDSGSYTAVIWASWSGHSLCLNALLECGADIDAESGRSLNEFEGQTALSIATFGTRIDCLKILLKFDVQIKIIYKKWGKEGYPFDIIRNEKSEQRKGKKEYIEFIEFLDKQGL